MVPYCSLSVWLGKWSWPRVNKGRVRNLGSLMTQVCLFPIGSGTPPPDVRGLPLVVCCDKVTLEVSRRNKSGASFSKRCAKTTSAMQGVPPHPWMSDNLDTPLEPPATCFPCPPNAGITLHGQSDWEVQTFRVALPACGVVFSRCV